jgi:hypothetical protein
MTSIVLAILLIGAAPSLEVQTTDNQTHVGPLHQWTADRLTIDTSQGPLAIETKRIWKVATQQKSPPQIPVGMTVRLIDGSTIAARQYRASGNRADIALLDGGELDVPADIVRSVRMQPASEFLNAEWRRLLDTKRDRDLLVVRTENGLDDHAGIVHDVSDEMVRIDLDGESVSVKRSKIYGLIYHRVEPNLPPAVCRIIEVSGLQWFAQSFTGGERVQWTTPAGVKRATALDRIAEIDFSADKGLYLSDIKPETVRWTPFFGLAKRLQAVEQFYAPRYNRNFEGRPLMLGGKPYEKGLALRANTEITFHLPKQFERFHAVVGIDDSVRPGGKARLVVRGDDRQLLSAAMTGNDPPRPINLGVTGVRRLTICVEFGDGLSPGSDLLLCNARLSR